MLPLLTLACVSPEIDPPVVDTGPLCEPLPSPLTRPSAPLPGLDDTWADRYDDGYRNFEAIYRSFNGLGPVLIHTSCAACHAGGGKGPGEVHKMVVMDGDLPAADQSALPWGHTERPEVAGGGVTPITIPTDVPNLRVTTRIGPSLRGLGYLEAIDDAEIVRFAAEQTTVSGRVNRVAWSAVDADSEFHDHQPNDTDLIGRFGLKARIVTIDEFVADAAQGDMGITSTLRPEELPNPDGLDDDSRAGVDIDVDTVNAIADYVRLLELPARTLPSGGAELFAQVGCADCHVPSLRTRADYPIPQLADVDAPLYTDVLLHDMGEALADGMTDGSALSTEWRTAPLVDLARRGSFLHDGRASSIAAAIEAHGGEALPSVEAATALTGDERTLFCGFVEGL